MCRLRIADRRSKALIHGRAIGASHARIARRWVSRLARQCGTAVSHADRLEAIDLTCPLGRRKRSQQYLLLQSA
jgi:hypothetical protein